MAPEGASPKAGFAARLLCRLEAALGGVCATPCTGCTPSATIAAGLARGLALREAVREAKNYLHHSALVRHIGQGKRAGPSLPSLVGSLRMGPEGTSPKAAFAARLLRWLKAALDGVCAAPNTRSTGCTPSATTPAGLARGLALREAKDYLHGARAAGAAQRIGQGRGPVHHFHRWWSA